MTDYVEDIYYNLDDIAKQAPDLGQEAELYKVFLWEAIKRIPENRAKAFGRDCINQVEQVLGSLDADDPDDKEFLDLIEEIQCVMRKAGKGKA